MVIRKKIVIEQLNPNYALRIWGGIISKGKTQICINNKGFRINSETYIHIVFSFWMMKFY